MSLRSLVADAASRLAASGVDSPRVDAELLLAHVLSVPRSRLLLVSSLSESEAAAFESLVERRAAREPLQHIVGTAPFLDLSLAVGPGVFIPRPETEVLAAWAASSLDGDVAVDLCSGSGALALAIASAHPSARVYAVESSPDALEWLSRNASAYANVEVVTGDVRTLALPVVADLVVANPPYVPTSVDVPPEVRADPASAVFAGPDGLDLIPAVAAVAASVLRPGGPVGIEHDDSHAAEVAAILDSAGFAEVRGMNDLTGRPRFTTAVKR